MTTSYDPQVIQQYCDELYREARRIVIWSTINSALLVGILGAILGTSLITFVAGQRTSLSAAPLAACGMVVILSVVGAILGAVNGYHSGSARAFDLKLTAQTALCQKQIELNTRRTALASMPLTQRQPQRQRPPQPQPMPQPMRRAA
jgi:hypothetical protein